MKTRKRSLVAYRGGKELGKEVLLLLTAGSYRLKRLRRKLRVAFLDMIDIIPVHGSVLLYGAGTYAILVAQSPRTPDGVVICTPRASDVEDWHNSIKNILASFGMASARAFQLLDLPSSQIELQFAAQSVYLYDKALQQCLTFF